MIIGQAIFQMGASFILYYAGPGILGYEYDGDEIRSVVFNTFVWMQVSLNTTISTLDKSDANNNNRSSTCSTAESSATPGRESSSAFTATTTSLW